MLDFHIVLLHVVDQREVVVLGDHISDDPRDQQQWQQETESSNSYTYLSVQELKFYQIIK